MLIPSDDFECNPEPASIEMADKLDEIATLCAAATMPELLYQVDREAISAATSWARADKFMALALQVNAATGKLVFDAKGLRMRKPARKSILHHKYSTA
jgi:hypothetical protein